MADNLGFGANPYLQPAVDSALGDTVRNYNLAVQPAFNSAMVRSGSFGNEGVNQMNSEAQRQLQTSLGRQANDMRYGDYWNDQNLNKSIYDTTFNQNQQMFQNGINLLGMQNNIGNQNLGFGNTIQNTPLDYYSSFNQQANSIGRGYGTTAGTMSASGSPFMGALAGWQLGRNFGSSSSAPNLGLSTPTGTPDYSGASTNGNGAYDAGGSVYNNPSAYIA